MVFNENTRVKIPAILHLVRLGYQYLPLRNARWVLEDVFGKSFAFTDSAHAGRKLDALRDTDFKPRRFSSFWEVAVETANSRFYGGIHTPRTTRRARTQA